MNALVICVFVAMAAADVSELNHQGYNYPQPGAGEEHASAFGTFVSNVEVSENFPAEAVPNFEPAEAPTVSKRFFSYTAQAHHDEDDSADDYDNNAGHKHYDVVFAHAPKPSLNAALKALSRYAKNQQTAVYVLSKKLGANEIGQAFRASGLKPNKPQVHFVKYKTEEEAAHAQHHIRSQYDALGGHSEHFGEQSAPVRSFVGALGRRHSNPHYHKSFSGVGSRHFSKQYLPPRF